MNKPPDEYGEWFVNEQGQTVRTVTRFVESVLWVPSMHESLRWLPIVDVEVSK